MRNKRKPDWISQEDWDEVCDTPEITAEEFAHPVKIEDILPPAIVAGIEERRRRAAGRPKAASPKQPVSIRLDREVVERLRADGPGWQSRINDILRKAVGL